MSDRLARLQRHRDDLERQLSAADPKEFSALSARYMQALSEIEALEKEQPSKVVTPLDEIAAKRSAKSSARTAGGRQRR